VAAHEAAEQAQAGRQIELRALDRREPRGDHQLTEQPSREHIGERAGLEIAVLEPVERGRLDRADPAPRRDAEGGRQRRDADAAGDALDDGRAHVVEQRA